MPLIRFIKYLTFAFVSVQLLSGCSWFSVPGLRSNEEQAASEEKDPAPVDGVKTKTLSASSGEEQQISGAGIDGLEQSQVVVPPGSLAIDQNVSLGAGDDIGSGSVLADLELAENQVASSGASVEVATDANVNPVGSLVVTTPLPGGAGLTQTSFDLLVVIYHVKDLETGEFYSGIIPLSLLTIDESAATASFETELFGTFQAVFLTVKVEEPKRQKAKPPEDKDDKPAPVPYALTITKPSDKLLILSRDIANFGLSGTCSHDGESISIKGPGSISKNANCAKKAWSVNLDLTSAADGVVKLDATHGVDTPAKATVSLTKDTIGPAIDIGSDLQTTQTVTLDATVSDGGGFLWNATGPGSLTFTTPNQLSTDATADTPGDYVVSFTAVDAAGNASTETITLTWLSIPAPIRVQGLTNDGAYPSGTSIQFKVIFSEPVDVSGTPQIAMLTTSTQAIADYASGSGTNELIFGFTSSATNESTDLDTNGLINLNGGTIESADDVPADLNLPTAANPDSLASQSALVLDATNPIITPLVNVFANGTYNASAIANEAVSWNWSKDSGTGTLTFGSGTTASTSITADNEETYTVRVSATDAAGNVASQTFNFTWDVSAPSITSVTPANDASDNYINDLEKAASTDLVTVAVTGNDTLKYKVQSNGAVCDNTVTGWTSTMPTPADLAADSVYQVCVEASDNATNADYMASGTITRDTVAPGAVTGFGPTQTTLSTETFTWTPPGGTITGYNVAVDDTNADCSSPNVTLTPGSATQLINLPQNKRYHVCISATDPAGNTSTPTLLFVDRHFCDSGLPTTTCVINSSKPMADGDEFAISGNLQIDSAGSITTNPEDSAKVMVGGNLVVNSGGSLYGNFQKISASLLTINGGAWIKANGKGFAPYTGGVTGERGDGPSGPNDPCGGGSIVSGGNSGSGGAGGGKGGNSSGGSTGGSPYGIGFEPTGYGCGGGKGANSALGGQGGGAIKLSISGTTTINGDLKAEGELAQLNAGASGGGGGGGSIWLDTLDLVGTGVISVKGGDGRSGTTFGGGGGGGRIYVRGKNKFLGTIDTKGGAKGGGTAQDGQPGTFVQISPDICSTIDGSGCHVSERIVIAPGQHISLGIPLLVENEGLIELINAGPMDSAEIKVLEDITVQSGGEIRGNFSRIYGDNITIDLGGTINANGYGFTFRDPLGRGGTNSSYGGGGGHGGSGAPGKSGGGAGGAAIGDANMPNGPGGAGGDAVNGTGGKGGNGGGFVKLASKGTITVNGTIMANGSEGTAPGGWAGGSGAGGSIWLKSDTLAGGGFIRANGANGVTTNGGGGGGGRIRREYNTNTFSGAFETNAGNDGAAGNPGSGGTSSFSLSFSSTHRAFVSLGQWTGDLRFSSTERDGLQGADKKCTDEATTEGLTGQWRGMIGTPVASAIDRIVVMGNVDDLDASPNSVSADEPGILDGTLDSPILYHSDNTIGNPADRVWTGSDASLNALNDHCNMWTSPGTGESGEVGVAGNSDAEWAKADDGPDTCSNTRRLYCISQP